MRLILLILSSTGCRIGALPSLKLGNLTKIPEHEIYSIVFYEGTNNEYYTFTTRECSLTGIDNYLLYRQRCSEKLLFKGQKWEPEDTPLIRLQFDATDILQASSTTYIHTLSEVEYDRSNIRQNRTVIKVTLIGLESLLV
jgi:hypothetical protein